VTEPHYADDAVTLWHGDCLDVMRAMPDASVDAVVTDPPYGLEFMGREWDSFGDTRQPGDETFTPGTGPYGRAKVRYGMAPSYDSKATAGIMRGGHSATDGRPSYLGGLNPKCRNCGCWQRGSNPCACETPDFPNERRARTAAFGAWCEQWTAEALRVLKPGGYLLAFGGTRTWHRLACAVEDAGFEVRDSIAWLYGSGFPKSLNIGDGRGTALKPAFEPIVVGRKPLVGTVAANVERHGTGALNIDGCRTPTNGEELHTSTVPNDMRGGHYGSGHRPLNRDGEASAERRYTDKGGTSFAALPGVRGGDPSGRWPTNVVLDGETADELDRQTGVLTSGKLLPHHADNGKGAGTLGAFAGRDGRESYGDSGGASRFFPVFRYEAKAPTAERPRHGDVAHPTVKPLDLMRWLVRLVTPPGGTVLEPFAGSGTTAEACVIEGFRCIAIEREAAYLPLIEARLSKPIQPDLFGGAA